MNNNNRGGWVLNTELISTGVNISQTRFLFSYWKILH